MVYKQSKPGILLTYFTAQNINQPVDKYSFMHICHTIKSFVCQKDQE